MSTLTGNQVANTYRSLIKVGDNTTVDNTLKPLSDGLGNQTALSVSDTEVEINGVLTVTNGITGSLEGNASTATTASFALSASNSVTASHAVTASEAIHAVTASHANTASFAPNYLPLAGGTITGDLTVTGTVNTTYLNVLIESSSVIFSSGSNILGDELTDTQTLIGTVIVSGSQQITGSLDVSAGVRGLFFRNETAPTFQNIITSNENIFNHGDLLIQASDLFIIEEKAEYYALGDVTNSGSLIVSGTMIVDGVIYSPGPIILAPGTGQIL